MKKSLFAGATLTALFSGHALANEPLTLVLDWYINPDHAPIMVYYVILIPATSRSAGVAGYLPPATAGGSVVLK